MRRQIGTHFSPALVPAVLGVLQPPLHMYLHVLFHTAQGERVEELLGGFLTGMLAWALCAGIALLLSRRFPLSRGVGAARVLSTIGLALFGLLAALYVVLFAGAAFFRLK